MMQDRIEPIVILLVEDNPADARLTAEGLKRAKVLNQLHVVDDGEEAIAFMRREGRFADAPRPDIVFLDLNLPKVDGREVLSTVKQDPDLAHIPIVVLTSSDADADILKAYQAKANCYVKKPVMFQEFLNTIKLLDDFWLTVVRLPRDAAA
jgi:two-component system, chemotaxis family, response regulator Rcp1